MGVYSLLSSHGSTYLIALSLSPIPAVVGSTSTPIKPRKVSTWFSNCRKKVHPGTIPGWESRFIQEFVQKYGYYPSTDDILYHLEQLEPERYNLNLGNITSEEGEPIDEFGDEFIQHDADPFGADLPDDIYELRELATTLTGRLRAVYEAMLQRMADGADRMTLTDMQREWGVSYNQIMKDMRKIKKLIRERIRYK